MVLENGIRTFVVNLTVTPTRLSLNSGNDTIRTITIVPVEGEEVLLRGIATDADIPITTATTLQGFFSGAANMPYLSAAGNTTCYVIATVQKG